MTCAHCGAIVYKGDGVAGATWYHAYGRHQCDFTGNRPTFATPKEQP